MTKAYYGHLRNLAESAIYRQTRLAAGPNEILSKKEQTKAPGYIQESAAQLREDGGSGTRVQIHPLDAHVSGRMWAVLESVNQKSGPGRAYVSKSERDAAASDPSFGPLIARAWQVAVGEVADVDRIAEIRAQEGLDPKHRFIAFSSESAASSFRDPQGRSVTWLVKTAEDESKASYVRGRDDLWVERFDVNMKTGAVTTTAEH